MSARVLFYLEKSEKQSSEKHQRSDVVFGEHFSELYTYTDVNLMTDSNGAGSENLGNTVVMVLSDLANEDFRLVANKSWASEISTEFVVGKPCEIHPSLRNSSYACFKSTEYDDLVKNPMVLMRQKTYKDKLEKNIEIAEYEKSYEISTNGILRVNVIEVLHNLSQKMLTGYSQLLKKYPKMRWVITLHDNTLLNTKQIHQLLKSAEIPDPLNNHIVIGDLQKGRAIRYQVGGKNRMKHEPLDEKIREDNYPGRMSYPVFPSGQAGFLLSRKLVEYLVDSMEEDDFKFYKLHDASIGIYLDQNRQDLKKQGLEPYWFNTPDILHWRDSGRMVDDCKNHKNFLGFYGLVDEFGDCVKFLTEGDSGDFEVRYYFDVDEGHRVTTVSSEVFR